MGKAVSMQAPMTLEHVFLFANRMVEGVRELGEMLGIGKSKAASDLTKLWRPEYVRLVNAEAELCESVKGLTQERDNLLEEIKQLSLVHQQALAEAGEEISKQKGNVQTLIEAVGKAKAYIKEVAMENRDYTARLELYENIGVDDRGVLNQYWVNEIQAMATAGKPIEQIAGEVGISEYTAQMACDVISQGKDLTVCPGRALCPFMRATGRPVKATEEKVAKIIEMHCAGATRAAISSAVDLSRATVISVLRAHSEVTGYV